MLDASLAYHRRPFPGCDCEKRVVATLPCTVHSKLILFAKQDRLNIGLNVLFCNCCRLHSSQLFITSFVNTQYAIRSEYLNCHKKKMCFRENGKNVCDDAVHRRAVTRLVKCEFFVFVRVQCARINENFTSVKLFSMKGNWYKQGIYSGISSHCWWCCCCGCTTHTQPSNLYNMLYKHLQYARLHVRPYLSMMGGRYGWLRCWFIVAHGIYIYIAFVTIWCARVV